MNQLLLCITFITFLIRISGYFPYYCGCNYAIGCYDDSSCCNGLVCVFNNGYSQCHEDPQYTKPSTSVPPCLHTNTDWGCRRNSDCCNPAAICGPQKICIFNQTCTMNYRYTISSWVERNMKFCFYIRSALPSSLPTSQPTAFPSAAPSNPSSAPSRQPFNAPSRRLLLHIWLHKPFNTFHLFLCRPSHQPTRQPSEQPINTPSRQPSSVPSSPSSQPSSQPVMPPSQQPSSNPTQPSGQPTLSPSQHPTLQPQSKPTGQPICKNCIVLANELSSLHYISFSKAHYAAKQAACHASVCPPNFTARKSPDFAAIRSSVAPSHRMSKLTTLPSAFTKSILTSNHRPVVASLCPAVWLPFHSADASTVRKSYISTKPEAFEAAFPASHLSAI